MSVSSKTCFAPLERVRGVSDGSGGIGRTMGDTYGREMQRLLPLAM
jgi:hypothetical protein